LIITVPEVRQYISTDEGDQALEGRLQALELLIRGYTNNNFQVRGTGIVADVVAGVFMSEALIPYEEGDTIQVSGSDKNDGLYTVQTVTDDTTFIVNERTRDEMDVYVTQVEYPADEKMGVVELLKYDLEGRDRVGIQSETISRHSVTYQAQDASNTVHGYPLQLMGFLKRHMKARFGQGLRA
jgi:hypothetical protein